MVAFRTWLRTFLHELCHHLDFMLLELPHSFHTEGFFKRESSLFHQLVPRPLLTGACRAPPAERDESPARDLRQNRVSMGMSGPGALPAFADLW